MSPRLDYRRVATISLSGDAFVDFALQPQGTLLGVAFKSYLKIYAIKNGANIGEDQAAQEVWVELATYDFPPGHQATVLVWTAPTLLAVGFDRGHVVLYHTSFECFTGIQEVKLSGRAVVSGDSEVCIWKYSKKSDNWRPSHYLPDYPPSSSSTPSKVVSVHWDNNSLEDTLIVGYLPDVLVTFVLRLKQNQVEIIQETTGVDQVAPGSLSPDGQFYVYAMLNGQGYHVVDLNANEVAPPFCGTAPRIKDQCSCMQKIPVPRFMFGGDYLLGYCDSSLYLWQVENRIPVRTFPVDGIVTDLNHEGFLGRWISSYERRVHRSPMIEDEVNSPQSCCPPPSPPSPPAMNAEDQQLMQHLEELHMQVVSAEQIAGNHPIFFHQPPSSATQIRTSTMQSADIDKLCALDTSASSNSTLRGYQAILNRTAQFARVQAAEHPNLQIQNRAQALLAHVVHEQDTLRLILLREWRRQREMLKEKNYMDTSNLHKSPLEAYPITVLAVYLLVATLHLISALSQADCSFLLKGFAFVVRAATHQSTNVYAPSLWSSLPSDIRTVLQRLNLGPRFRTSITCPRCSKVYVSKDDQDEDALAAFPQECDWTNDSGERIRQGWFTEEGAPLSTSDNGDWQGPPSIVSYNSVKFPDSVAVRKFYNTASKTKIQQLAKADLVILFRQMVLPSTQLSDSTVEKLLAPVLVERVHRQNHSIFVGEIELTMFRKFCSVQNLKAVYNAENLPDAFCDLIKIYEDTYQSDTRGTRLSDIFAHEERFGVVDEHCVWKTDDFSSLSDFTFSLLQEWGQYRPITSPLPRTVVQRDAIFRFGQRFATYKLSPSDSQVVYIDIDKTPSLTSPKLRRHVGIIREIFSQAHAGQQAVRTWAVIQPLRQLTPQETKHDPYRSNRFRRIGGCLFRPGFGREVVVDVMAIRCHFASCVVEMPAIEGECVVALPLNKD
ncbi:hypothetical protein CVT24_005858 [Panaeolus cyanescens]|uniref:Uncharacterized protein n=1 Tax=Panaeolus cyanescens TaxID=181874 RepID=A0A409YEX9_9AGAR|nr:hypothetical protein CVT24_005858 [Panaeolus cyanescens]